MPESSMLTTRLPSHPMSGQTNGNVWRGRITGVVVTGVESHHPTTPRHYRRLTYTYTRLTTIINGQSDVPRDRHTDRPHCNGNNRSHLMQWISMQPKILLCADKSCKQLQQRRRHTLSATAHRPSWRVGCSDCTQLMMSPLNG